MGVSRITRPPSCLVRHGSIYYFRAVVPKDLRPRLKQREYRLSLRTGFLTQANTMAISMKARLSALFYLLRQERGLMTGLTDQHIKSIAKKWLKQTLEQYEEIRLRRQEPWTSQQLEEYLGNLDHDASRYTDQLLKGNYELVEIGAQELLVDSGIQGVEKGSLDFRRLCSTLLKAMIAVFMEEKRIAAGGDLDIEIAALIKGENDIPITPPLYQPVYSVGAGPVRWSKRRLK